MTRLSTRFKKAFPLTLDEQEAKVFPVLANCAPAFLSRAAELEPYESRKKKKKKPCSIFLKNNAVSGLHLIT